MVNSLTHSSSVIESLTYLEDQQQIALGSNWPDNMIQTWCLNTGKKLKTFSRHTNTVTALAYLQSRKQLISGSDDKTLKLWDLSGKELDTFHGHTASVNSIVDMPDLQQVASGSRDGTIKIWDLSKYNQ